MTSFWRRMCLSVYLSRRTMPEVRGLSNQICLFHSKSICILFLLWVCCTHRCNIACRMFIIPVYRYTLYLTLIYPYHHSVSMVLCTSTAFFPHTFPCGKNVVWTSVSSSVIKLIIKCLKADPFWWLHLVHPKGQCMHVLYSVTFLLITNFR